jgi:hypothetical protein
MQRPRVSVRNLSGLRPWYNYFIAGAWMGQSAIIMHDFLAAAAYR